ncbi:MAG: sugar phosphate isomerase/epimerase [Fimbriimonadaceae bacterium]|nr:sugar phosphate isomerase/epimerase [Fimbriimonadaceae bacterium]
MDIQLGIWNLNWSHFTFEEALAGIRATGYSVVSLYPAHSDGPCYTEEFTDSQIDALKDRLEACGLTCAMLMAVNPTASRDAARRRIDMAQRMGVPYLCATGTWEWVTFLQERKSDDVLRAEHEAYVSAWREVIGHAADAGVTVTLKPHGGNSATGAILKATIDDVGSPAFQASVDAGNVRFYEGLDPVADVDPILPHARTMCLKDHSGPRGHADFPIIGDGGVDHPWLLRKLQEASFSGPMLIERFDGGSGRTGINYHTVCQRAVISRENILRIAAGV